MLCCFARRAIAVCGLSGYPDKAPAGGTARPGPGCGWRLKPRLTALTRHEGRPQATWGGARPSAALAPAPLEHPTGEQLRLGATVDGGPGLVPC
jgi:hypothetical protein